VLVEEFLGRLDRGELPSTARERLAEQVTREQGGADEARLASLWARVSDIEAFSDPVERLSEEHGPQAAVLDRFDERLAALEGLDERVSEFETHAETVGVHENRIERLGRGVTALGDELDMATTQLETEVAEIETQLESLRTELKCIESSVETAQEASDAGALDERLADLEEQLGGFERQLDSVAGNWESVEADVAAPQEWRSNLASTFEFFRVRGSSGAARRVCESIGREQSPD
jgi:chromosome segregation ATPase